MLKQYFYLHYRVLMNSNEATMMGFLTDGYSWRLFQFDAEFMVDSDERSLRMLGNLCFHLSFLTNLGLLTLLAGGVKPELNNQDNCPEHLTVWKLYPIAAWLWILQYSWRRLGSTQRQLNLDRYETGSVTGSETFEVWRLKCLTTFEF